MNRTLVAGLIAVLLPEDLKNGTALATALTGPIARRMTFT